ncbi:hypothetical protein F5887DRAFT_586979 [Amanita rubescens]|nr:hypothetical protein F5887DRAFT_586979 [Amanita rubescens]
MNYSMFPLITRRSGGNSTGSSGSIEGDLPVPSLSGTEISTSSEGGLSPAVIFGSGGGRTVVIPSGHLFAGRTAGGGTRAEIYGTSQYGSGYPNITGPGTTGRGFPFYFWPVVWAGNGTGYLYPTDYGLPTNTSRPGGPLATAVFPSNFTSTNTTYRILSDNHTLTDLIPQIIYACRWSSLEAGNLTVMPYNESSPLPRPEQAIQYYRASSIVLTLDGYNNTADLTNGTSNVVLPSNIDQNLLMCLNTTIGVTAPIVNAALGSGSMASSVMGTAPTSGLLGFAWIIWLLLYLL